jgi:diacylglycerol kinase (ATP)
MNFKGIIKSFSCAFQGLLYTFRSQRNMGLHLLAAILALAASFYFKVERTEFLFVILAISLVFITELLNTALEAAVDLRTKKYHPLARIAKNVSAGAVLLAAFFALVVAFLVFADKLGFWLAAKL